MTLATNSLCPYIIHVKKKKKTRRSYLFEKCRQILNNVLSSLKKIFLTNNVEGVLKATA